MSLIGEGANACAYRPQLPCTSEETRFHTTTPSQTIGKVFRVPGWRAADEEVTVATTAERFGAPDLIARCQVARADAVGCAVAPLGSSLEQLVYEDVGQASLREVLARPAIGWVEWEALLRGFAVGVLGSLDDMRREGFVHMDIHAGNVVVGRGGAMRLIDFSWVRPLRTFWSPRVFMRFAFHEFTHGPPATPHSDWGPLARRATDRLREILEQSPPPPPPAPQPPETAGFDPDAAGRLLWALALKAGASGSGGPPPPSRSHVLDAAALVAAGLTHPDVRVRVATAADARRALLDALD